MRNSDNPNAPYWIKVRYRYPGRCARCGKRVRVGARALYAPVGRKLYCDGAGCGESIHKGIERAREEKEFLEGRDDLGLDH